MHIVWAIIAGLVIGGLARLFLRGSQHIPLWLTCFLGIVGGLIGNGLSCKLGVRHTPRHRLDPARAADLLCRSAHRCASPALLGRPPRTRIG